MNLEELVDKVGNNVQEPNPSLLTQSPTTNLPEKEEDNINSFLSSLPQEAFVKEAPSLTQDDVLNDPERMQAIRDMMVISKDTHYQDAPAEEVLDDFMSHMRWFSTNEASTFAEALAVRNADEETKRKYGEAYRVYDEIGGLFTGGSPGAWKKVEGVYDYASAAIFSPSTILGLGVGKVFGGAAAKGTATLVRQQAIDALASETARRTGVQGTLRATRDGIVNAGIKNSLRTEVAGSLLVEAPIATIQDYLYQNVMLETGVQDERNIQQTVLATILGSTGALLAPATRSFNNASGLSGARKKITAATRERRRTAGKRVATELKKSLSRTNTDWVKLVNEGKILHSDIDTEDFIIKFMIDEKNPDSFISLLKKNGAVIDRGDGRSFSAAILDIYEAADQEVKDLFDEAFQPIGVQFHQVAAIFAKGMNRTGSVQNLASEASKSIDQIKKVSVGNRITSESLVKAAQDGAANKVDKVEPHTISYLQSVWKRLLVSHPGTTVLNVKGWGFSRASTAMAQALQAGSLYGMGSVQAFSRLGNSSKSFAAANALTNNLVYSVKAFVDPYISVEAFMALMEQAPKKMQSELKQQFFQGVDNKGAAAFGMNPNSIAVKNTERLIEVSQKISFVTLQDTYTKAISGITELDKQVRLNFGKGIDEMVNLGRVDEITDDMWHKTVEALQRETFSQDFSKAGGEIGRLAGLIQKASNTPFVGVVFPFGQFANSILAFTARNSPVGFVDLAYRMSKGKAGDGIDVGFRASQAMIGTAALGMLALREGEKEAEGLAWNEERDDTGAVYKVDSLFPWGFYNLLGRIGHRWGQGDGMDSELLTRDLVRQLAIPAALQELTNIGPITDVVNFLVKGDTPEDDLDAGWSMVASATKSLAGIASGFTRPLDPFNDMAGAITDYQGRTSQVAIDKRQLEGGESIAAEFTRYADTFFNNFMGTEQEDGRTVFGTPKASATQEGDIRNPNPIAGVFGGAYQQSRTNIDRILGMVNKAPFRVDQYTGVPEYDHFVNDTIFPLLENKATVLLSSPAWEGMNNRQRRIAVDAMINDARKEIRDIISGNPLRYENQVLNDERRKYSTLPVDERTQARNDLGITTSDDELTLWQMNAIRERIKYNKEN